MAWLLGIGAAVAGGGYLLSSASEYVDMTLKPVYDYKEKSAQDTSNRELEKKRQERHKNIKETHYYHNELRTKYNLKDCNRVILTNDTSYPCNVVYVNHYHATNEKEAIRWAKEVLETTYFKLGLFNRLSTKMVTINILETMDILLQEQKEYYIVLNQDGQYFVLNQDDYAKKNISVYEKLHFKQDTHDVDIQCSSWFKNYVT
jgi:hypothetical protein